MNNIAIVGANGNLGRCLSNYLNNNNITEYSSSPNNLISNQYLLDKIHNDIKKYHLIIFLCYSTDSNEQKKIEILFKKICLSSQAVMLISTFTIYSSYQSRYNRHKSKLENIIKTSKKWYIVRPGLVHGLRKTGINKLIHKLRKLPFILLPGGNSRTGVVHIEIFLRRIKEIIEENKFNNIYNIYNEKLTLIEIFRLNGFRGKISFFSKTYLKPFLSICNLVSFLIPAIFESYLNLVGMKNLENLNEDVVINQKCNRKYFTKIVFYDHIHIFKKTNKLQLYSLIKNLSTSSQLKDYLSLKGNSKFLYHLKIHELLSLVK